jgi:hypothetical protein
MLSRSSPRRIESDAARRIESSRARRLEASWSVNSSLPDVNITELRAYIEVGAVMFGTTQSLKLSSQPFETPRATRGAPACGTNS